MAKFIRHDYGAIHEALNKMIIAEVKAALELIPGKCICWDGETPLCHIVLSPNEEYIPRDVSVIEAHIAQEKELGGALVIAGYNDDDRERFAINWFEDETDWINITDFGYLIDQIAERVKDDKTVNLPNKSLLTAGYVTEWALRQATEKTI
jgi:hypothetical protein